jgi:YVTN family beta-propeller protein
MCTRASRRSHLVPVAGLLLLLAGLTPASAYQARWWGPSTLRTSPDGKRLYVLTTDGFFHVFDTATYQSLTSFRIATKGYSLAVSPDGSRIYIPRPHGDSFGQTNGTLLVIESATNRPLATVEVGLDPWEVAVSPDGRRVYVANQSFPKDSGTISVVDAETLRLVSNVRVGGYPRGLAVSPDGAFLYVSRTHSSYWFPSVKEPSLAVIDTEGLRIINTVPVPPYGEDPIRLVSSPDGKRIYVSHNGARLTILDTTPLQVAGTILKWLGNASGAAISPDGKRLYSVYGYSGAVVVLDTESLGVRLIGGSFQPALYAGPSSAVALSPDGSRLYVSLTGVRVVRVLDTATEEVVATLPVENPSPPAPQN